MRVVFMGTPEFAVPTLRSLVGRHDVVAVLTRPDAVSGRGGHKVPSPVASVALQLGLELRQPATLRDPAVQQELRDDAPEVIVVAAYGLILPREVLDIPTHGCINVHGSLLPRWRGAAPIHRAVLAGDEVTGISIMRMEEGLDTGPYCVTRSTPIADKSVPELTDELAALGAEAVIEALQRIEDGACSWVAQDDSAATYAEKIDKSEVVLAPELGADELLRRIRASTRQAPARAVVAGREVTVIAASSSTAQLSPAAVHAERDALHLGCADGAVEVRRVKPSGKGEMAASDWVRGARLSGDETWGGAS